MPPGVENRSNCKDEKTNKFRSISTQIMSLITEYNLSFSDIENCTSLRKPRSIKPQQYVQAADYEREILTKLPQIAGTAKPTSTHDNDNTEGMNANGGLQLGIKGVGKLHRGNQESIKYNKTEGRKQRKKKRQKIPSKFSEDCYGDFDDIQYQRCQPSLLPSIKSKQFTRENKATSTDKAGRTMPELTDYFRCHHGNYDKVNTRSQSLAGRSNNHDRHNIQNADVLLAEAIEKDKNEQKQVCKQLERSVLRGRGMTNTSTQH